MPEPFAFSIPETVPAPPYEEPIVEPFHVPLVTVPRAEEVFAVRVPAVNPYVPRFTAFVAPVYGTKLLVSKVFVPALVSCPWAFTVKYGIAVAEPYVPAVTPVLASCTLGIRVLAYTEPATAKAMPSTAPISVFFIAIVYIISHFRPFH